MSWLGSWWSLGFHQIPSELVKVLVVTMTPHKTTHRPVVGEAKTDPRKSLWCFIWHRIRPHKTPHKTFTKTSRQAFSLWRFRWCQKVASAQDSWPRLPSQDHRTRLPTKTFTKPPCHQDFARATKDFFLIKCSVIHYYWVQMSITYKHF